MLSKTKAFLVHFVLMSCVLVSFRGLANEQVDPFYRNLLGRAEKAFLAKSYSEAARDFEIAAFGLVQDKNLQAKAYIYLGLSHYHLKDFKKSEGFLHQGLDLLQDTGLSSLQISESVFADLEKVLTFFNIRPVEPVPPANPPSDPSAEIAKQESPPNLPRESSQKTQSTKEKEPAKGIQETRNKTMPLSLDQIKEGTLVPADVVETMPVATKRVPAAYPASARNQRIEGTVIVNALISETGAVIKTEISKGIPGVFGFNHAAEQAVRRWKFEPATIKGIKVRVWMPISIQFKAQELRP